MRRDAIWGGSQHTETLHKPWDQQPHTSRAGSVALTASDHIPADAFRCATFRDSLPLITFACYIHNYLVNERSLAGIIDTQMNTTTSLKTGKAYKDICKNIRLYKANPLNEYGSETRDQSHLLSVIRILVKKSFKLQGEIALVQICRSEYTSALSSKCE